MVSSGPLAGGHFQAEEGELQKESASRTAFLSVVLVLLLLLVLVLVLVIETD